MPRTCNPIFFRMASLFLWQLISYQSSKKQSAPIPKRKGMVMFPHISLQPFFVSRGAAPDACSVRETRSERTWNTELDMIFPYGMCMDLNLRRKGMWAESLNSVIQVEEGRILIYWTHTFIPALSLPRISEDASLIIGMWKQRTPI